MTASTSRNAGNELSRRALFAVQASLAAQVASVDDDVRAGSPLGSRHLLVLPTSLRADQPEDTILRPPAPSFASIAERKDFERRLLRRF